MSSSPPSPPRPESAESSPQSSPVTPPRPVKRARWQVYGFRDGEKSQPCSRTLLRWQDHGFVPVNIESQHEREVLEEQDGSVQQNIPDNFHQDSMCDSAPDSSDSELPLDTSSNISDSSSDIPCRDNRWYDSDEERFHEDVLLGNSDDENDEDIPLYLGSKYSKNEAILDVLDDYFNNKESQQSLKDHLATFVKFMSENNSMPKSVYHLFSYLKKLAPSYTFSSKYYCSKCLLYHTDTQAVCLACSEASYREFYMFDLEEQIRFYFEHYNLADMIDKYRNKCLSQGKISDICHGSEYKRFHVNGRYTITLVWNTDGVSLSKSSKCHLYPILCTICELPPRVRSRFIIVAGVWCDKVAPPMNTLLRPFCDSLIAINDKGGVTWNHPQTGEKLKSVVSAPLCVADAPVRAQIQNIQSHSSKHACNTCEQKSDSIPLTAAQRAAKAAGDRSIRKKRGFIFKDPGARLRSGPRMVKQARKAFEDSKTVKGVLGPSVVQNIPHLDLGTVVLAEYMHGSCLGVGRYFANLWIHERGPWYIGDNVDEIDDILENIKPCDFVCRLPRKISDLFKWKASELRVWVLFYSVIIITKFLPPIYVQHWMLFVNALWLLLQDEISELDLQTSETMVNLFVKDIGRLYGQSVYIYNVHQLLHLPLYVRRWGPLWATSAFMFEGYNGTIADLVHGTKNRAKELVNLLQISHGLEILREQVQMKRDKKQNVNDKIDTSSECKQSILSDVDKTFLVSSGVSSPFRIFARVTVNGEQFTSLLYKDNKRINFCVGFKAGRLIQYGLIKYFIDKSDILAVVTCLEIDKVKLFFHERTRSVLKHILPVKLSDKLELVPVNSLIKLLKVDSFVCLLPNTHEKNL